MERLLKVLYLIAERTSRNPTFSIAQLRTLLRIYRNEPVHLCDFKKTYGINSSKLSRALEALVILGLVVRTRNPDDARKTIASMTDQGRILVEDILEIGI